MTNPLREIDSRESGNESHETLVEPPPEAGRQATRQKTLSETVGGASQDAPRQFSPSEAIELLVASISNLDSAGKVAVAAGVSAKMRLLDPSFSLPRSPYQKFRELVLEAERRGVVETTQGANDLILKLRGQKLRESHQGEMLRTDLWRAMLDWTDHVAYEYNRNTRATTRAGENAGEGTVSVPFLSKDERIQWMKAFAESETGDPRDQLTEALKAEGPVGSFHHVVRANDSLKRRWNRQLRRSVIDVALAWAGQNGIPASDIFVPPAERQTQSPATESHAPRHDRANDEQLRQRVLAILAEMPLHELLRLPIPLEYSLIR